MSMDAILISIIILITVLTLFLLNDIKKRRLQGMKPEDQTGSVHMENNKNGFISKLDSLETRLLSQSRLGKLKIFKYEIDVGYILFAIILVIGAVVRIYNVGGNPPGLNQDEASGGYDAYSLLNYGVDRNGDSFPVHLVSWGSGMHALGAYFLMPFLKIFGLTEVSTSMANITFGIISIILLFFGVKMLKNIEVALISSFILAISPWHIMSSRWGLLENIMPAIVMIGVFFFALSTKKPVFFFFATVFMALSLYAYSTANIVIPATLLIVGLYELYFASNKKACFIKYTKAFIVFLIVSIPWIIFIYINIISPESKSVKLGFITIPKLVETGTRYKQVVFLSGDTENIVKTLSQNFKYYFDTVFKQEGAIWNVIKDYGNIYLISNLFFVIGFISAILSSIKSFFTRKIKLDLVFLVLFIFSTVLGIIEETNTNRMNIIFIPMIYLVGYGIYILSVCVGILIRFIAEQIPRIPKKIPFLSISKIAVIIIIVAVYLNQFNSFCSYYFTDYPRVVGGMFRESFKDAIDYTVKENSSQKTVYVSNFTEAYVYVLFYTKYDPREFYKTVEYQNPQAEFRPVLGFGNYRFIPVEGSITPEPDSFYIVENDKVGLFGDVQPKKSTGFKNYTVLEF